MKNPNAFVGAASAGVGGQIVLEVTSWFGWTVSSGLAIWVAAGVVGVVLFVGRNGLKGVWKRVWGGQQGLTIVEVLVVLIAVGVLLLLLGKSF